MPIMFGQSSLTERDATESWQDAWMAKVQSSIRTNQSLQQPSHRVISSKEGRNCEASVRATPLHNLSGEKESAM
jgi:hypothetical protein